MENITTPKTEPRVGLWHKPPTVERNNFIYKALSSFAYNVAVGCEHACRFCYVPDVSTRRLGRSLEPRGVKDPASEWGEYVFVRPWNEKEFLASLARCEAMTDLNIDGNRAIFCCSTTDAFQVIKHPDAKRQKELAAMLEKNMVRGLELIRDKSTLNVRILTRSPLARKYFDLFKSFGPRLMFGMSIPSLNPKWSRIYEPKAPNPQRRFETLQAAVAADLNVYVAMAPTYPECDETDLRNTLEQLSSLAPYTIFHEPINIRGENVDLIKKHAASLGVTLKADVFNTRETWQDYAWKQLHDVERIAGEIGTETGLPLPLHLWPDKTFGSQAFLHRMTSPASCDQWLQKWWKRVSEWPVGAKTISQQ